MGNLLNEVRFLFSTTDLYEFRIAPTSMEERIDPRLYQMFTVWFSAILGLAGSVCSCL